MKSTCRGNTITKISCQAPASNYYLKLVYSFGYWCRNRSCWL